MKYLGMLHIGKLACAAIHNLEAIFTTIFTLQSYFTKREVIYNLNKIGGTTSSNTPYGSNKSAFQLIKLNSWTWASLRRRRLLLIMWPIFEKLLSEVALDAGTHNVCLAMMVNNGQRLWRSFHHVSPEAGRPHCIRELWYASTWFAMYERRVTARTTA